MFSVRTIYIQFFTPPLDHKEYFSFYSLYFKTGRRTPSKNTIKKKKILKVNETAPRKDENKVK